MNSRFKSVLEIVVGGKVIDINPYRIVIEKDGKEYTIEANHEVQDCFDELGDPCACECVAESWLELVDIRPAKSRAS